MELSGQVAIVTGAGRGIGRATALELAGMGADIVVAEMDLAGAERTAAAMRCSSPSASTRSVSTGSVRATMWMRARLDSAI